MSLDLKLIHQNVNFTFFQLPMILLLQNLMPFQGIKIIEIDLELIGAALMHTLSQCQNCDET